MKTKTINYLLILTLLIFVLLQIVSLQNISNPSYDAYYEMRQVEQIKTTGLPILKDDLSYQGRTYVPNYLTHYFLTGLSYLIPQKILFLYGGILLNIISLLFIFKITKKLYSNKHIALLVTVIASLTIILFKGTLATLNSTGLFILVYLMLINSFINLKNNRERISNFVIIAVVGALLSPLMLIVLLGMFFYLILLKVENLQIRPLEVEIFGFIGLLTIWYNIILYQAVFRTQGISALWNSIPKPLIAEFFQKLSLPILISQIGIIPFFLGAYAMYQALFARKRRYLLSITAITIILISLLTTGLINLQAGLLLTTINMILLSGFGLKQLNDYFNKLNYSKIKYFLILFVILIASINLIANIRSLDISSPTKEEIKLLQETKFDSGETILGSLEEGQFIAYETKRKTFYDDQFIKAPNSRQRFDDARKIFLSKSKTTIISLLDYYKIKYIYLSEKTKQENPDSIIELDKTCFKILNEKQNNTIYEVKCTISN